ncbi:uncharacterized protein LOC128678643 isoform X2 [Plodia interpunctella]|uniref:uncharacterized protein LOC128678643 isoform X2 n=1 Tax=Plodia interpunctella TaxID=58824 RepID=UPI0023682ED4|nr:uncharacterized protein LOC128678643 isoform X2 [Plodia interpunctella]
MIYLYPFALIFIMCSAAEDFYYPYNLSRTTPLAEQVRIAAVRKSLTLDWLKVEDNRQRELVSAFEKDVAPPMKMLNTDCISYLRPSSGKIGRLMLELLKNLEGDDNTLILELIQVLVRAKLLVETSAMEAEPDFEALMKTPKVMMGEPHTTFPRILSMVWLMATDTPTLAKHGWCPIKKVNKYLEIAKPTQIAKHMRTLEPLIMRVRYIMEDFIQNVTPLNMYQKKNTKKDVKVKTEETTSKAVKRPLRAHDLERENLERLIGMTTLEPNTTFKAERLPNLDFNKDNAVFMTAGATTLDLCRFVSLLGNMLWITMMIYDL